MLDVTSRYLSIDGGELHYVEQGSGQPIVLLHGFPEFWYSWRFQIPALAAGQFRVIAPDLRGYNLSNKPKGITPYRLGDIAEETASFIRTVSGGEQIVLAGHDWGGALAWNIAKVHPQLVRKLIILNVPHPRAIRKALRSPVQILRFWYQFAVQPPVVPEMFLSARRFAFLCRVMRRASKREGALTEEDLERYRDAWSQPGALTAMLNYYRAAYRRVSSVKRALAPHAIQAPTLLIHGERDPFFGAKLFDESKEHLPSLTLHRIPEAGHFVHQDAPEKVTDLILSF